MSISTYCCMAKHASWFVPITNWGHLSSFQSDTATVCCKSWARPSLQFQSSGIPSSVHGSTTTQATPTLPAQYLSEGALSQLLRSTYYCNEFLHLPAFPLMPSTRSVKWHLWWLKNPGNNLFISLGSPEKFSENYCLWNTRQNLINLFQLMSSAVLDGLQEKIVVRDEIRKLKGKEK